MINKVQENSYMSQSNVVFGSTNNTSDNRRIYLNSKQNISFGASPSSSNFGKKCKLLCRNLFNYMSETNEVTNAIIAAIGTGIIAPAIILVSPGKGDKEDKDKKFFQAIRQPLSAVLAFAFQFPATRIVTKMIEKLAYDKKVNFFADKDLGSLIPDNDYLKNHATKAEIAELEKEFNAVGENGEKSELRKELETLITDNRKEVGLNISEEDLAKQVKKKKENFLRGKVAKNKRNEIFNIKLQELLAKNIDVKDIDLVSENDQVLAIHRNKDAYNQIEKEAKLSRFDKILKALGFSNKKINELQDKQKLFAKEKGLEILKADNKEIFASKEAKLRKYIETLEDRSKSLFKHRTFLISLFVNLFMVTLSCYALNWAHPRFKEFLDKKHNKQNDQQQNVQATDGKKVEVKA